MTSADKHAIRRRSPLIRVILILKSARLFSIDRSCSHRRGAGHGAVLWLAYGVVECWMLGILPWLSQPAYSYRPLHPGLTALLFGLYPLVGAATGIAAARVMADDLA